MPVKTFNPYTPSRRFITVEDFSWLTKKEPEKSLTVSMTKKGGRNNTGEVMVRHQGGGHKQRYRIIDFKRDKMEVPAKVIAIEYDPNRSARLALLQYADGEKRYMIAPVGVNVNDEVISSKTAEIKVGNAAPLETIPPGIPIHNVEFKKGSGARIARSAGN